MAPGNGRTSKLAEPPTALGVIAYFQYTQAAKMVSIFAVKPGTRLGWHDPYNRNLPSPVGSIRNGHHKGQMASRPNCLRRCFAPAPQRSKATWSFLSCHIPGRQLARSSLPIVPTGAHIRHKHIR